jgi:hypothetical protein
MPAGVEQKDIGWQDGAPGVSDRCVSIPACLINLRCYGVYFCSFRSSIFFLCSTNEIEGVFFGVFFFGWLPGTAFGIRPKIKLPGTIENEY